MVIWLWRVEDVLVDKFVLGSSETMPDELELATLDGEYERVFNSNAFEYFAVGYFVQAFHVQHDSVTDGSEAVSAVFELLGYNPALNNL